MAVRGLPELDAALTELPRSIAKRTLRFAVLKAARVIVESAAQRAPRDTGALAASIMATTSRGFSRGRSRGRGPVDESITARIGPTTKTWYGIFTELGTVNHPAHPWLRPALDEEGPRAVRVLGEELGTAIDRAAKRLRRQVR